MRSFLDLVDVSNELFLRQNMFFQAINYTKWNNLLSQINKYVEENAKDLLNRKDSAITGAWSRIIESNNELTRTIRSVDDTYLMNKHSTPEQIKKGEDVIRKS